VEATHVSGSGGNHAVLYGERVAMVGIIGVYIAIIGGIFGLFVQLI
jgi:hypothetical protein